MKIYFILFMYFFTLPLYSQSYLELNRLGYAISVEIWIKNRLIGGLLGVIIGACFFGESMFSLVPNGSKLALICTMARLVYG